MKTISSSDKLFIFIFFIRTLLFFNLLLYYLHQFQQKGYKNSFQPLLCAVSTPAALNGCKVSDHKRKTSGTRSSHQLTTIMLLPVHYSKQHSFGMNNDAVGFGLDTTAVFNPFSVPHFLRQCPVLLLSPSLTTLPILRHLRSRTRLFPAMISKFETLCIITMQAVRQFWN